RGRSDRQLQQFRFKQRSDKKRIKGVVCPPNGMVTTARFYRRSKGASHNDGKRLELVFANLESIGSRQAVIASLAGENPECSFTTFDVLFVTDVVHVELDSKLSQ